MPTGSRFRVLNHDRKDRHIKSFIIMYNHFAGELQWLGPSYWFALVCDPLYCDHFDEGSECSWREPVDLATIDFDATLRQRIWMDDHMFCNPLWWYSKFNSPAKSYVQSDYHYANCITLLSPELRSKWSPHKEKEKEKKYEQKRERKKWQDKK